MDLHEVSHPSLHQIIAPSPLRRKSSKRPVSGKTEETTSTPSSAAKGKKISNEI